MSIDKKSYFQGGGGVNEPTPKKKKYKSDPAIVVQPRFKEPFYRNYDLYNTPGEHSPGAGWHDMEKYKSVSDFLKAKRKKLKDKYKADDSWILDDNSRTKKNPNMEARAEMLAEITKTARMPGMGIFHTLHRKFGPKRSELEKKIKELEEKVAELEGDKNNGPNFDYGKGLYSNMDKYDSVEDYIDHADKGPGAFFTDDNDIDFPLDDQISEEMGGPMGAVPEDDNPVGQANLTGGYLDEYLPEDDFEGKPPTALDFGRDYTGEISDDDLRVLIKKYLSPDEGSLLGLPDGMESSELDADQTVSDENPEWGISDHGNQMYEDKWNI